MEIFNQYSFSKCRLNLNFVEVNKPYFRFIQTTTLILLMPLYSSNQHN